MHLVIGAVASALLAGRADRRKSGALSFWGTLEVAHELPGRIRLRCPALAGATEDARRLMTELPRLPGVSGVRADARVGSIVVTYDATRIGAPTVQAAILKLLGLEHRVDSPAPALLTRQTNDLLGALNHAIMDLTRGVADLDFLVPTLLMTFATVEIARKSRTGLPAGMTLLWWAFAYMTARNGRQ